MKRIWYKNKWVKLLMHITAWVLLFFLPYLLGSVANTQSNPQPARVKSDYHFLLAHLNYFLLIGFFYLNAMLLIPALFYKKKYGLYTLAIVLCFAFYAFLGILISTNIIQRHTSAGYHRPLMFATFSFVFILACSTAFRTIRDKIIADNISRLKEHEFLKTELALLRSQVSPHFMFNVLNNMVSLARKKSDLLEPSLIQLSSLMRYKLYDTDGSKISLEKECEYLLSYIGLQQQRFSSKINLSVNIKPSDKYYEIESMLLIPFVENAFKHGTGMIENPKINIDLYTANDKLFFTVENNFNPATQEIKDKANGIGLTNVQRRLLLLYPKDHVLKLTKSKNEFKVSLEINLTA